jgi:hypothetical protein
VCSSSKAARADVAELIGLFGRDGHGIGSPLGGWSVSDQPAVSQQCF